MFGNSDVNADSVACHIRPVEPGVANCFIRAIHSDRPGSGSPADIFLFLISQFVKITHASEHRAHVTRFVIDHTGLSVQKILTELRQTVSVRGSQSNSGDYNSILIQQEMTSTPIATTRNAVRFLRKRLFSIQKPHESLVSRTVLERPSRLSGCGKHDKDCAKFLESATKTDDVCHENLGCIRQS